MNAAHIHQHPWVLLVLGILLLFLGRKLFWFSVAAIGFVFGIEMAPELFPRQPELQVIIFAIVLGIVGALVALLLQRLAIALAGFFFGAHTGVALAHALLFYHAQYYWIYFIAGGVAGAIVMVAFFDWGLIILSSLVGAHLIVGAVPLAATFKLALFVALAIVGILVQAAIIGKRRALRE
jgi:Domain of unknown function (DUF4203)